MTDAQIAVVLRTALNPNNRFLPINNPIRIPFLLTLANVLIDVKRVARKPYGRLLDELIHSYREILHIGCPILQVRGDILWNLGIDLLFRFDENGIKQDFEDSIKAFRDCLAIANHSKPQWIILHMLGLVCWAITKLNFASGLIPRTISMKQSLPLTSVSKCTLKCLALTVSQLVIETIMDCTDDYMVTSDQPTDDTLRLADIRDDLGLLHLMRFKFHSKESLRVTSVSEVGPPTVSSKGCEEDLNVAIYNYEESHHLLRVCNRPISCASRVNLVSCYSARFRWLGDREDMEKSIELCRTAMSEISPSDKFYPDILLQLAYSLDTRYNTYGHSDNLHEAITHIEQALTLCPDNTFYRNQRAGMYQFRSRITNDVGDLDTAISEARKCLDSNTLQGSDQALAVRQLARGLTQRFETTRVVEDLKEAIEMVKELVDELRQGVTVRSNSDDWQVFSEYGDLLDKKFEVTGDINDLHESRDQFEMALRLVPYHSNNRPAIMHNYAGSLLGLYENTKNIEYLDKSIDLYCKANVLYRGNNTDTLYHCGVGLVYRVEQRNKQSNSEMDKNANQDLKDALKYLRDAENLAHPDHPIQSRIQEVLAYAHLLKGGSENQQIAFKLYERAVKHITAFARNRLRVGRSWIRDAIKLQDFKEATRAYGHTMDVLYRSLSTNPTISSQHQLIQSREPDNESSLTFASDAAYAAIRAGNPKRAVELLEQGRGLLWSRLNHYQYPLDQLKEAEPMLAKRYEELSKKLENLAISPAN